MDKKTLLTLLIIPVVLTIGIVTVIIQMFPPKIDLKQATQNINKLNNSQPQQTAIKKESTMSESKNDTTQDFKLDKNKSYTAVLNTTKGVIKIKLNAKQTPFTVNNFVMLSKKGFYNNTIFHRTIENFMIQGGDPNGDGTGGPGYRFNDEPFEGEYIRGTIAMANAGPNTNGSQFFIMHKDYPLPHNYVIFGSVIEGIETVDAIATAPTTYSSSGEKSKPLEPVKITSVDIIEE